MKTSLFGAAAAFVLAAVAFSGGAQAQCWWSGYNWSCSTPPATAYAPMPYYSGAPGYPVVEPTWGYGMPSVSYNGYGASSYP